MWHFGNLQRVVYATCFVLYLITVAECGASNTGCPQAKFTFTDINNSSFNIPLNPTGSRLGGRLVRISSPGGHRGSTLSKPHISGPRWDHTFNSTNGLFLVFVQLYCRLAAITSNSTVVTTVSTPAWNCPSSNATCDMNFFYSMSGRVVGNLSVRADDKELLLLAGDQGTGDGWKEETVQATFKPGQVIQFFFDAYCNPEPFVPAVPFTIGDYTSHADGDIGLDDISVKCTCASQSTGPCVPPTTPATTPQQVATQASSVAATHRPPPLSVPTATLASTSRDRSPMTATQPRNETVSTPTVPAPTSSGNVLVIVVAVVASIVLLVLLLIILFCWRLRRRKDAKQASDLPIARYTPASGDGPVTFDNRNYNGVSLMKNGMQRQVSNGVQNGGAAAGQVPAAPSHPPPSSVASALAVASPRDTSPDGEDEDYDEPECNVTHKNPVYCKAGAPKQHVAVKRYMSSPTVASGEETLPRYDHLDHGDIDPEVYAQPFQEPGSTPAAIYNQLSGQAYRHIPAAHVTMHEKIGSGSFGIVYRGSWKLPDGMILDTAVKQLRPNASEDMRLKLLQEAAIMGQFNHRNVVKLYGVVTDGRQTTLMVVELMGEDLKTHLVGLRPKGPNAISMKRLLQFSTDVALGMEYLSARGFVHRDLAARNIMLDARSTCKVGDFGMSRDLEENNYYTSAGGAIPVKWTAPEAIHFRQYSCASDVWSYGIVLYEIYSIGKKPYAGWPNEEVAQKVRRGYRLPPPENCPQGIIKLMMECWHEDKHRRPQFPDIITSLNALSSGGAERAKSPSTGTDSGTAATGFANDDSSSPRGASPSIDTFALPDTSAGVEYDVAMDVRRPRPVAYTAAEMSRNRAMSAAVHRRVSSIGSEYDDVVVGGRRSRTLSTASTFTETDI